MMRVALTTIAVLALFTQSAAAAETFLGTFVSQSPQADRAYVQCYANGQPTPVYNGTTITKVRLYKLNEEFIRIEVSNGERVKHNVIVREISLCMFDNMTFIPS
jgi:hypothetical protein